MSLCVFLSSSFRVHVIPSGRHRLGFEGPGDGDVCEVDGDQDRLAKDLSVFVGGHDVAVGRKHQSGYRCVLLAQVCGR